MRKVVIFLLGWQVGCLPLPSQTVVDLTHAMGDSAITWPSNDPFAVTKVALVATGYSESRKMAHTIAHMSRFFVTE